MNWITLSNLDLKKGYLFTFKPTPPNKMTNWTSSEGKKFKKRGKYFFMKIYLKE